MRRIVACLSIGAVLGMALGAGLDRVVTGHGSRADGPSAASSDGRVLAVDWRPATPGNR